MDRDELIRKIKVYKTKTKDARKSGKKDQVVAFRNGMRRLQRKLKALEPKTRKKKEAETPAEVPPKQTETPAQA